MRFNQPTFQKSFFTTNYSLLILLLFLIGCGETTGLGGSTPEPTARLGEPLATVGSVSQSKPLESGVSTNQEGEGLNPAPLSAGSANQNQGENLEQTEVEAGVVDSAESQPLESRSISDGEVVAPTPTLVPTPEPTPTPEPSSLRESATLAFHNGDYVTAITHLTALIEENPSDMAKLYIDLGIAYKEEGVFDQAEQAFGIAGQLSVADGDTHIQALSQFHLAETYNIDGRCAEAVSMYEAYLSNDETLRAYVVPRIALCQSLLGGLEAATESLESVEDEEIHYLSLYENRLALGQLYELRGMSVEAAEIYEKIALAARTDFTFAQMLYKAGLLNIENGEEERGYAKLTAVYAGYFQEPSAHEALKYLLENEQEVDQVRRGVVNYHAGAYVPCVEALEAGIAEDLGGSDTEYTYYNYPTLAECYEGIGDFENAERWMLAYLDEVEARTETSAYVNFQFKTMGDFYRRNGQNEVAIDFYERVVGEQRTTDEREVWLAEETAESYVAFLVELGRLGDAETVAIDFAEKYNTVNRYSGEMVSAEILYTLAQTALETGETEIAQRLLDRSAELDLQQYSYATAIWQNKLTGQALTDLPLEVQYYSIRHNELLEGDVEFQRQTGGFPTENTDRIDAILFMQERNASLGFATDIKPDFTEDAGYVRGRALWELREYGLAKREFEAFNIRFMEAGSPLERLVLSETYRDIGFYNGSIRVAIDLIVEAGENIFTAPPYLARLAYPIYYADLIESEADAQGLDPYLVTAMIRQESLFESFATSSAVAQGLAQVIPDTGAYIAQQIGDTGFENEDLFKPVVGVAYGAYYLSQQIDFFDGSVHAGLAAYNAGPGNAQFWFETAGDDLDLFVETIGFDETEQYVKRIYSGYTIYKHLYLNE